MSLSLLSPSGDGEDDDDDVEPDVGEEEMTASVNDDNI